MREYLSKNISQDVSQEYIKTFRILKIPRLQRIFYCSRIESMVLIRTRASLSKEGRETKSVEMIGRSEKARREEEFSLIQYVQLFTSFREIAGWPPARFNGSKLAESELAKQHAIPISEYRRAAVTTESCKKTITDVEGGKERERRQRPRMRTTKRGRPHEATKQRKERKRERKGEDSWGISFSPPRVDFWVAPNIFLIKSIAVTRG